MATDAHKKDDWYLDDLDAQEDYRDMSDDGVETKKQSCLHITISRSRKLIKVNEFAPIIGEEASCLAFLTGPNTPHAWSLRGKKFTCSRDKIAVSDTILGEATQSQVWEYYGDWEDVPDTKWKPA